MGRNEGGLIEGVLDSVERCSGQVFGGDAFDLCAVRMPSQAQRVDPVAHNLRHVIRVRIHHRDMGIAVDATAG